MAKGKTSIFFCQSCGYESSKWMGQCPGCKEWNTFVEEVVDKKSAGTLAKQKATASEAKVLPLSQIEMTYDKRVSTDMKELDRVLGGGIVQGSMVLVGGDPGIGKSTLLLQVCRNLSEHNIKVLYISGEESLQQIKIRAERIGNFGDSLKLLCETNLDTIKAVIDREKPQIVVIDSIQTMYRPDMASAPGSVSQVRECASLLMRMAKTTGCAVFLVGHVTKEGAIAGPRVLEHMVDVVLYFEGDRQHEYRILRAVKNRFGSVNEIGLFEMHENGMVPVENPSELLLSTRARNVPGSCVHCAIEGSRPMLVDVQALALQTAYGMPRRTTNGFDSGRLALLLAVLEKRAGVSLFNQDVYVNVAGGLELSEPAADLPLCAAVASSVRDACVPADWAVIGEVGLAGEIRAVSQAERRLAECARLGFTAAVIPRENTKHLRAPEGMRVYGVETLAEALAILFG